MNYRVIGLVLSIITLQLNFAFGEIAIGKKAPNFSLLSHNGENRGLSDFRGKWVVLEWFNDGCPFVKKHYESENMQKLQRKYTEKGVVWLSIVSSAPGKQGYLANADEASSLRQRLKAAPTFLLLDPEGRTGQLYGAKTTPHMFIIGPEGNVVYQGAIDSINSTNQEDLSTATNYVDQALSLSLSGEKIKIAKTKPYGCSVKYK